MCSSLVDTSHEEKTAINSMFERETNRERGLQSRLLTQRRLVEMDKNGNTKNNQVPELPKVSPNALKMSEDKFWNLLKKNKPDKSTYKMSEDDGKLEVTEPLEVTPADDAAVAEATRISSRITTLLETDQKVRIVQGYGRGERDIITENIGNYCSTHVNGASDKTIVRTLVSSPDVSYNKDGEDEFDGE